MARGQHRRQQLQQKRGDIPATVGHAEQAHRGKTAAAQAAAHRRPALQGCAHIQINLRTQSVRDVRQQSCQSVEVVAMDHQGQALGARFPPGDLPYFASLRGGHAS